MVKKVAKARSNPRRRRKSKLPDNEESILREATKHLILNHGMFLVATGLREVRIRGIRAWIITVTLRYADRDETYIGDLLYDGVDFTFLTEQSVLDERARKLAEDPERIRKWNEHRTPAVQTGKA